MADFPPNLDDGELWLPSDIRREISSTKTRPENKSKRAFVDNIAMHHRAQVLIESNKSPLAPNFEIRDGNGRFSFWKGGFQAIPEPIPMYNTITPPQVPVRNFDIRGERVFPGKQNCPWPVQVTGGELNGFAWKSGGTGVFLPRVANSVMESEEAGGTGAFLGPSVAPTTGRKKKRSGKICQATQKVFVTEDKAFEKKEESQLPPEICLPKDWMY